MIMTVVLCTDGVCDPPKCPVVDVQEDKVIIEIWKQKKQLKQLIIH